MSQTADEHVPVLIVGGGLVGLSAALMLSKQDIPYLLIERHSGTSIHPRSRGVNGRTMEIYRELGLEDQVRVAGAAIAESNGILSDTTLAAAIAKVTPREHKNAMAMFQSGDLSIISPTTGARVTQDMLEPVLLAAARERGGDLRFGTEFVSFEQDDDGVTATIRDRNSGTQRTIRADYLLAADGAGSAVRKQLAMPMTGRGSLGHLLNILFQADLSDLVRGREFSMCLIHRPEVRGLFTSINNSDRWVFHLSYAAEKGETPEDYPPERCLELLCLALGLPDVAVTITSILPWESAVRVAENFKQGRVLLAGDAAHQMPPWGGKGGNSGVADAHNLAWKLAYVLKGQASPALLDTYTPERRPVVVKAAEESGARADERGLLAPMGMGMRLFPKLAGSRAFKPVFGLLSKSPNFRARLLDLLGYGYIYRSQAILADEKDRGKGDFDGSPGTRAPHVWLERQGQRISTLDLFGRDFVLLAGTSGADWVEAARQLATQQGIGLDAYRIAPDGDLLDPEHHWQTVSGIGADGALLIRPDGIVAWRASKRVANPQETLAQLLHTILGRSERVVVVRH